MEHGRTKAVAFVHIGHVECSKGSRKEKRESSATANKRASSVRAYPCFHLLCFLGPEFAWFRPLQARSLSKLTRFDGRQQRQESNGIHDALLSFKPSRSQNPGSAGMNDKDIKEKASETGKVIFGRRLLVAHFLDSIVSLSLPRCPRVTNLGFSVYLIRSF